MVAQHMRRFCLWLAMLGIAWVQTASADTHYVSLDGGNVSPYTNGWTSAAITIQLAINASTAGDTVLVSNGVYQTGGTVVPYNYGRVTNRVYISKAITVRSLNNDPANTIIKGAWNPVTTNGWLVVRCVYMAANSTLIGFTLTNGATLSWAEAIPFEIQYGDAMGGGVLAANNSAMISNCLITKCIAFGDHWNGFSGGGAFHGTYYNCTFSDNWSPYIGGGVQAATLYNCLLVSNSAAGDGGATRSEASKPGVFYNCLFYGNSANDGGAVGGTAVSLYNCTLVGNRANQGGGIYSGASPGHYIYNSIIYSNYSNAGPSLNNWGYSAGDLFFTNSCTWPAKGGWNSANTTNNPLFIAYGSGYGLTHVPGNYHLQVSSPCVNRGTNQAWMPTGVDLDGRPRLRYGTVDMGAYELIYRGAIFKFR